MTQEQYRQVEAAHKAAMRNTKRFQVTAEHIKLLCAASVGWEYAEFGAPGIDPKRPFGNSGDRQIFVDMAQALGWKPENLDEDDLPVLSVNQRAQAYRLYLELEVVLQIVLRNTSFDTGLYERPDTYSNRWTPVPVREAVDGN